MSATTPEGRVKRKVVAVLKKYDIWYFFPANNGFGIAGIPDIIAVIDGVFTGIEVKADKTKKPTELQRICGERIKASKDIWLVVYDDETLTTLTTIIKLLKGDTNACS